MVKLFLQMISTLLLFGASLLLLFWKKEVKVAGDKLIRRIGLCIALIGFYTLGSVTIQTLELDGIITSFISIPTLLGLTILMFSLLGYLEAKK